MFYWDELSEEFIFGALLHWVNALIGFMDLVDLKQYNFEPERKLVTFNAPNIKNYWVFAAGWKKISTYFYFCRPVSTVHCSDIEWKIFRRSMRCWKLIIRIWWFMIISSFIRILSNICEYRHCGQLYELDKIKSFEEILCDSL